MPLGFIEGAYKALKLWRCERRRIHRVELVADFNQFGEEAMFFEQHYYCHLCEHLIKVKGWYEYKTQKLYASRFF